MRPPHSGWLAPSGSNGGLRGVGHVMAPPLWRRHPAAENRRLIMSHSIRPDGEIHLPTPEVKERPSAPAATVFMPRAAPSQNGLDDRSAVAADAFAASSASGIEALLDSPAHAMLPANPNDALAKLPHTPSLPAEGAAAQHAKAQKVDFLSLSTASNIDSSLHQAFTAAPLQKQVETLDRLADTISPRIGRMIRGAFRHPPVIVGQAVEDYYELANAAIDEFIPHGLPEVLLLKAIVDDEWLITTFSQVRRSLLNAAIAAGLVDRLRDRDGDADGQSSEGGKSQSQRQWRRTVFAAVSGDEAMRSLVEEHVGRIGFDAFAAKRLLEDIRTHIFADNVINAALKRRNSAIRQLGQMQEARYKNVIIRAEKLKTMASAEKWQSHLKSLTDLNKDRSSTELAGMNQSSL
jgi:hypothetical protein